MIGVLKKKTPLRAKGKKIRKSFCKFRTLGRKGEKTLVAKAAKNCDCSNGWIANGLGISKVVMEDGEVAKPQNSLRLRYIFSVREHDPYLNRKAEVLYLFNELGHFSRYNYEQKAFERKYFFNEKLAMCQFRDEEGKEWIFFAGTGGVFAFNNSKNIYWCVLENVKPVICAHENRIFFAKDDDLIGVGIPGKVSSYFSARDHGGSIFCGADEGKLIGLKGYGKYVYVFYDYAVYRLSTDGSIEDFVFEKLPYKGGKIIANTADGVGDYLLFLASDGIWRVNTHSKKVEKIYKDYALKLGEDQSFASASAMGENVIISYQDSEEGNITLVLSPDGKGLYKSVYMEGITSVKNGKTLCSDGLEIFEYSMQGELPSWEHYTFETETDFGVCGVKNLQKLYLEGEGRVRLQLTTSEFTMDKMIDFSKEAEMPVFMKGDVFHVNIFLEKNSALYALTAEMQTLEG